MNPGLIPRTSRGDIGDVSAGLLRQVQGVDVVQREVRPEAQAQVWVIVFAG